MAWYAWFRYPTANIAGSGSGDVSGVKGAVETFYRKGNVNISIPNLTNLAGGLTYDEETKTLSGPQHTTMPTPSSALVGSVIQYVGEDTSDYIGGRFYKCVTDGSGYSWQEVTMEANTEELTAEQLAELLALIGGY